MSRTLGEGVTAIGLDVGFVCQSAPGDAGGTQSHVRTLARGLVARGHRVHVLCVERESARAPYSLQTTREDDLEVCRMAAPAPHTLAELVADPKADDVVLAWLAETPCDVIHAHHLSGFGAGALRAIADMGRPLCVTLHDAWLFCPCGQPLHALDDPAALLDCAQRHWAHLMPSSGAEPFGPDGQTLGDDAQAVEARRVFALECLDLAQRLIVPSEAALEVAATAGVSRARLRVIEHGLETERIARAVEAARAPRAEGAPLRLGVLGSVLPGKGVVELCEAFVQADAPGLTLEVHGPLVSFHGDEAHLERVRELAGGHAGITLHGAYGPGELARVLAGLDAVAAPSTWPEFYGLGVREARAAGLPVLVSDRGGLAGAAQDGAAGRVLCAGDRDAWALALREFAQDAATRARWASAPRAVRTAESMTLEMERLYVELALEVTGHVPELVHSIEGLAGVGETPPAPVAASEARRGLLGRLFGRSS